MTPPRRSDAPAPRSAGNAFTVDLEEWFHVCGVGGALSVEHWDALPSRVVSTTRSLLDLLDRTGVRATFFVVGWVAERHPRLIEAVRDAGHEIGSHGHQHRRVYDLDPPGFRSDLRASVAALQGVGIADVRYFRAPEWSVNERSLWALDTLVRERFTLDASMAPVKIVGSLSYPRTPHVRQTPAGPIAEVPPLVADRFGQVMPLGWGWGLRMSSPRRVLRAIDQLNQRGVPAVLTVHPWEIDPDPPRTRLPAALRFAHYFRLDGFRARLQAILAGARFGPIGPIAPALPALT
jgi:polysaccharide deacetylase family protein (PEP-CTERM system associated)